MTNPIVIRAAELTDIDHMTDVFFRSFNQGFWKHFCPDCAANRNFIADMWIMGLESSHDRTFVAIDTSASDAIVGFSRWQAPLYSRNKAYESWPEPSMLDQQIAIPFFASEDTNRNIVMGDRPHWYLDIIGVDEQHQKRGIAKTLIDEIIEIADQESLEVFLHGTEMAQAFYRQTYGFQIVREIQLPDHPAYGTYCYASMVRTPLNFGATQKGKL